MIAVLKNRFLPLFRVFAEFALLLGTVGIFLFWLVILSELAKVV